MDSWGDVQQTSPVHVSDFTTNERLPDIAASQDETSYLMAYQQQYSDTSGPYGIHGRSLYADNTMGDAFPVKIVTISHESDSFAPAIEGGPGKFFVAWEQMREDRTYRDILGRSVLIEAIFDDGFENGDLSAWSSSAL